MVPITPLIPKGLLIVRSQIILIDGLGYKYAVYGEYWMWGKGRSSLGQLIFIEIVEKNVDT